GNWWDGSSTGVPGAADTAAITLPGNYTVTMPNANVTVGGLTLGGSSGGAQKLALPANGNLLLKTGPLTITTQGLLDLNDNDLMIDYASNPTPLAQVVQDIRTARQGG